MSALQILGALLVASPFIALFVYMAAMTSVLEAAALYLAIGALVGLIFLGLIMLGVPA